MAMKCRVIENGNGTFWVQVYVPQTNQWVDHQEFRTEEAALQRINEHKEEQEFKRRSTEIKRIVQEFEI